MVRVELYDNCPSATSLRSTTRELLWRVVSQIEQMSNDNASHETSGIEQFENEADDTLKSQFPSSFATSKRSAPRKKKRTTSHFSSFRLEHNLFLACNKTDGLWYPVQVLGVGPSLPALHFSMVTFLGYHTTAEVHRASELADIPLHMKEDVINLALQHYTHDDNNSLSKYWDQRYRLFTKYDYGIQLDSESWFSVTPEVIAVDIATKCRDLMKQRSLLHPVVLDCFSGVGGNAIALARQQMSVIAVDIDMSKLKMLKNNAAIYAVEENIELVCTDAYQLLRHWNRQNIDIIVLAPPWGGIDYTSSNFDLRTMIGGGDGIELVEIASRICQNIVYIIPRNTSSCQLSEIARSTGLKYRLERVFLHNKHKMNVVYFGGFTDNNNQQ